MKQISRTFAGLLAACMLLVATACWGKKDPASQSIVEYEQPITKDVIANLNHYLTEKDKAIIEGYGKRHKLPLSLSDKGFFFYLIDEGSGAKVEKGSRLDVVGSIKQIDGTVCYTYSSASPKEMVIGKSAEFLGLQMALPMLSNGGKAVFIFPPNLGYGLLGDGSKIPARAILVAEVEVAKVY